MPDKTSILFICHDGGLYGSQRSLLLLLKHLDAARYDLHVSVARPGVFLEKLQALPHVTIHNHKRLQWIKHDTRNLLQWLGDALSLVGSMFSRTAAVSQIIRENNIQIVHTNSTVSLEGALAAKMTGIPHIWHIRELFMEKTPKLQPTLGRWLTKLLVQSLSAKVICISRAVQKQFEPEASRNPQKYPVIYNALEEVGNVVSMPERPADGRFRIGYIGRLSEGKRFQDLVEAVGLLSETIPRERFEILVAGTFVDSPYEKKVRRIIREQRLSEQVRFLGYREDLGPILASLNLLVVPSLNEPFGRVVIEGMQARVPCVGADSGGIPEIIEDGNTGFLYPSKNAQALSRVIQKAMGVPELLEKVKENAGRMVRERFTIALQVNGIEAIYRAL